MQTLDAASPQATKLNSARLEVGVFFRSADRSKVLPAFKFGSLNNVIGIGVVHASLPTSPLERETGPTEGNAPPVPVWKVITADGEASDKELLGLLTSAIEVFIYIEVAIGQ